MTDNETAAAIKSLAYRIRQRDEAMRNGGDFADPDVLALEFMTALRGQGWRHTEAKVFAAAKAAADAEDIGPSEATRAELGAARQRMDAINEAKRIAREAEVA